MMVGVKEMVIGGHWKFFAGRMVVRCTFGVRLAGRATPGLRDGLLHMSAPESGKSLGVESFEGGPSSV